MSVESRLKAEISEAYARVTETLEAAGRRMDEKLKELRAKADAIAPRRATSHTNLKPVR